VSTATKARVDTAYQRLREHLAYLGLSTAAEELAPALDRANKQKLSAIEVLEDLLAREAEATRARRLHGRRGPRGRQHASAAAAEAHDSRNLIGSSVRCLLSRRRERRQQYGGH